MASTKLTETAKQLAYRAVHVKIHPRPRLPESREILRILQGYGEVVMFRNLQYEYPNKTPNTIIAIYKDPESATKLIAASPLTFTIEPVPQPSGFFNIPFIEPDTPSPTDQKIKKEPDVAREFWMSADISTKDHQGHISRQHYHGGYNPSIRSQVPRELAKAVPVPGMSQMSMRAPERPQRTVRSEREALAKRKSLRKLWEEGMQASDSPGTDTSHSKAENQHHFDSSES